MARETNMVGGYCGSRKVLLIGFILTFMGCILFFAMFMQQGQAVRLFNIKLPVSSTTNMKVVEVLDEKTTVTSVQHKDTVDNSGAINYLQTYADLFQAKGSEVQRADPNNPESIKTWWQAAAMIDWYINTPLRYKCKNKVAYGNWHVCQDPPYTVQPPCLVYSFGINFDFSFDDAMAKLGCEVHSFDPSMNWKDKQRGPNSTFHNLGLSNTNTDGYIARKDMYVKDKQVWKMRTIKSVMKELGHEKRTIDVLKIDIEGYEWNVIDNMIETDVFKYIRQFMLEFHLFPEWPVKEDYVYLYKIYTRLREMGFREYSIGPHPKTLKVDSFNNQGDCEYVNAYFDSRNS